MTETNPARQLTAPLYFVSGIDTDAGKTVVTGWLARELIETGKRVATLKFVQTGAEDFSPDIAVHRKIMGVELPEDKDSTTAPQIFTYPASPHLATELDGRTLDLERILSCIEMLHHNYDVVLVEGAGGLMVPLTRELLTIDFVNEQKWPVVFVGSGKLGSINHALLSLEALHNRGMTLSAFVWNDFSPTHDAVINKDTHDYLESWVKNHWPQTLWLECPVIGGL